MPANYILIDKKILMIEFTPSMVLNIFTIFLLLVFIFIYIRYREGAINLSDCDKVTALVEDWVASVSNHNIDKLLSLYLQEATLIPTYSPRIISNQHDRREYFNTLLLRRNLSVAISRINTQVFGKISISNGIYTFHYINDDNVEISTTARFSFVCKKTCKGWAILTHHSSALPIA